MGRILCERCKKKCKGDVLKICERYYHKECFTCSECNKGLESGGFYEEEGKLFCPHDFEQQHIVHCNLCGDKIQGEVVSALNKSFHKQCFRCFLCRKCFHPGDHVTRYSSKFYCTQCFSSTSAGVHATQSTSASKLVETINRRSRGRGVGESEEDEGVYSPLSDSSNIVPSTSHFVKSSASDSHAIEYHAPSDSGLASEGNGTDGGYISGDSQHQMSRNKAFSHAAISRSSLIFSQKPPNGRSSASSKSVGTRSSRRMEFGNPFMPSYLKIQEKHQQLNPRPPSRERSLSPHFHIPQNNVKPSPWVKSATVPTGSSLNKLASKSNGKKQISTLPYNMKPNSEMSLVPPKAANHLHSKLSPVAEQPTSSDFSDPTLISQEVKHLSTFPAAHKAIGEAPIDRYDWPAPPESSIIWMERMREKRIRQQQLQALETRSLAAMQRGGTLPPISTTMTTTNRRPNTAPAGKTRQILSPDKDGLGLSSAQGDMGSSSTADDAFLDAFTDCGSMAESDFAGSMSLYEDARSIVTDAGICGESGLAKAILYEEQVKSKSYHALPADPVSASRTPDARAEPRIKLRYERHQFASPSRDTSHSHDSRHHLGYSTDYVSVGNRHLTQGQSGGGGGGSSVCSSSRAVNSLASVLQAYDELRLQSADVNDVPKTPNSHYFVSPESSEHHKYGGSSPGKTNSLPVNGVSALRACLPPRCSADFINGNAVVASTTTPSVHHKPHYSSTFTSSLSISIGGGEESSDAITGSRHRGQSHHHRLGDICSDTDYRGLHPHYPHHRTYSRGPPTLGSRRPIHGGGKSISTNQDDSRLRTVSLSSSLGGGASSIGLDNDQIDPLTGLRVIGYDELKTYTGRYVKGINQACLETYLSEEDFFIVFNMSRDSFYLLPEWKQNDLKRRVHLY